MNNFQNQTQNSNATKINSIQQQIQVPEQKRIYSTQYLKQVNQFLRIHQIMNPNIEIQQQQYKESIQLLQQKNKQKTKGSSFFHQTKLITEQKYLLLRVQYRQLRVEILLKKQSSITGYNIIVKCIKNNYQSYETWRQSSKNKQSIIKYSQVDSINRDQQKINV